jgi:hypothetical protein
MHSDVSLFYSYTVVAETHFVIVTVPLVSLLVLGGPVHREPIAVCFSNLPLLIVDPPLLCLRP